MFRSVTILLLLANGFNVVAGEMHSSSQGIPTPWLVAWKDPPPADRPLQIVHGNVATIIFTEESSQVPRNQASVVPGSIEDYRQRGLGGVVCNVVSDQYLRSNANWDKFLAGVKTCATSGMAVWLYDEDGYPSGAAGGLVLASNPQFEAIELAYDSNKEDPFIIRPSYEHTHACNNFHAARRYINLLDERATQCFLDTTHAAYFNRIGPELWKSIHATFTDEPSLMAVDLGQLPEDIRNRVRVVDPIDPKVKQLPCIPWNYDLVDRYRDRYGEDIVPHRRSLFEGNSAKDRQIRRNYWSLIADLVAQRYFGKIAIWCEQHGVASSGHTLWEESLIHHVPLEGNALKVLGTMHIPGLDMLSSDPTAVLHSGWMAAALPTSAALLNARRRVMTEVSDFIQKMGGQGPVDLPGIQATAAWQAAWGVTDFTLYYGMQDRPVEKMRAYTDFVGRLNAILKEARPDPQVLLYYPIYDLWSEYLPDRDQLTLDSQTERARQIIDSFMKQGQWLQHHQVPFCLIDHEQLAKQQVGEDGCIQVGEYRFTTLLIPAQSELPAETRAVVDRFQGFGGKMGLCQENQPVAVDGPYQLNPHSEQIASGRFNRDGRQIILLVNVGKTPYSGLFQLPEKKSWIALNPQNGDIHEPVTDPDGNLPLSLGPHESLFWVEGCVM